MSYAKAHFRRGTKNRTEIAYAAHLELLRHAGEVLEYAFEPMRLRIGLDNAFYTPDYRVVVADGTIELHEVKGAKKDGSCYVTQAGLLRIKAAAAQHPFRFVMVWQVAGTWRRMEIGEDR